MVMTRWDPFQDLLTSRHAADRMFQQSLFAPTSAYGGRGWALPLDVYVEGENYVIEAALPGLNPEAVNVEVLGNQVAIRGEYPAAPEGRQYLFRERAGGRFERVVALPTELEAGQAEAHYEHGLLRLVVPKAETARPKRIALIAAQ